MMYYVWLSLSLIFLFAGVVTTFILLFKYESNIPACVAFGITLLLIFVPVIGTCKTKPEEQVKEYKYCPYCGEEVEWREIK